MKGIIPSERHPILAHIVFSIVLMGSMLTLKPLFAQVPSIPQIPAFLPTVDQVSAFQAIPLDGTWMISSIRKKIRIEARRAYEVDSWVHLFVLKVEPSMVIIKNITPTGPGAYSGEDLPLMGKWTAKSLADRSLSVTVAAMMPVNYKLIPIQLDNPQWYAQEMKAAGLVVPTSAPSATPGYQFTPPGGGSAPSAPRLIDPHQQAHHPLLPRLLDRVRVVRIAKKPNTIRLPTRFVATKETSNNETIYHYWTECPSFICIGFGANQFVCG